MATVVEVATVAAEKADDGQGRQWLCIFLFWSNFFSLIVTATATEGQGNGAVSTHKAHSGHVVLVNVVDGCRRL